MNTFMFDFNNGKAITNPLEDVTHFYVSPYEVPAVWTLLDIGSKVTDLNVDLVIQTHTNLPVIVMPLSILNLGKCMIKIHDDLSGGRISTGKKTLYFKFMEQDTICITGVH